MSDYTTIFTAAAQLPVADRERLIDELTATLPENGEFTLSREWLDEIERRGAEIESGAVETVDWETVRRDLFRRVGLDRGA
jgi:putative addiction module component (TIGR02574 family)